MGGRKGSVSIEKGIRIEELRRGEEEEEEEGGGVDGRERREGSAVMTV